jgi:hypothetical protein
MPLRRILTVASACGCLVVATARALPAQEDALATIVRALEKEAAAPRETTDIVFTMGDRSVRHTVRRVAPDRVHLRAVASDTPPQEVVRIGSLAYQRVDGEWQRTSVPVHGAAIPSIGSFLPRRLKNAIEDPPTVVEGLSMRVLHADIGWPAESGPNVGNLTLMIEATTLLPRRTSFVGQCSGKPCTFEQRFEFPDALSIDPPR